MGSRIKNIKPPCGYSVEGIAKIWLLDFDDFNGYRFDNNGTYQENLVVSILRSSEFTELDAPDKVAKYSSSGAYVHTLQTFVGELSANSLKNLHLGTKRRQLVLFQTYEGRYYTFGWEAGAKLTYVNQTAEGLGSAVTLTASSIYPLFETTQGALTDALNYEFIADFEEGAYCEIN